MVVGDREKKKIKAIFIYQDKQMTWDLPVFGSTNQKFYPARIGTMFNAKGANGIAEEYGASGLEHSVCDVVMLSITFTIVTIFN